MTTPQLEKPHYHDARENVNASARRFKCPLPKAECPVHLLRGRMKEAREDRAWSRDNLDGET